MYVRMYVCMYICMYVCMTGICHSERDVMSHTHAPSTNQCDVGCMCTSSCVAVSEYIGVFGQWDYSKTHCSW